MRFDLFVRGVLGRLTSALLVVLLAGPHVAPGSLSAADERAASSAHDDGMTAAPTHAAAADLAATPSGPAAPPASATERMLVSFRPLLCGIVTHITSRLPVAVKPAPTNLRL
jgi:hypothetical protein